MSILATEKVLRRLAKGCSKHPAYRYKRMPTSGCTACGILYDDQQELDRLDAERAKSLAETLQRLKEWPYGTAV